MDSGESGEENGDGDDDQDENEDEDEEEGEKKDEEIIPVAPASSSSSSRSSPRKRKAQEEEVSDSSVTPAQKKVIITEKFPNNPSVNYSYGFFNSVKQNAVRAQALLIREKAKAQTPTSA